MVPSAGHHLTGQINRQDPAIRPCSCPCAFASQALQLATHRIRLKPRLARFGSNPHLVQESSSLLHNLGDLSSGRTGRPASATVPHLLHLLGCCRDGALHLLDAVAPAALAQRKLSMDDARSDGEEPKVPLTQHVQEAVLFSFRGLRENVEGIGDELQLDLLFCKRRSGRLAPNHVHHGESCGRENGDDQNLDHRVHHGVLAGVVVALLVRKPREAS
mmetsp:Transcript_78130/g.181290  ORF Transcript_78130/g.181290 Transcript_78130/m.181290 type:complete len:217 (-) Transcript_78130:721-1371(-)